MGTAMMMMVAVAWSQDCDPTWPDACVHPTAQIDPTAEISDGASVDAYATVGPGVGLGMAVVAPRATLAGRSIGSTVQPVGDGTVIGRRAYIGLDASIGFDVSIARAVTTGTGLVAHDGAMVGYASQLGDDVELGENAVVGSLVDIGHRAQVTGVVARAATLGDDAVVTGVVGPEVEVGVATAVHGRVRKTAILGERAVIDAGARVGRGAQIGDGVVISGGARVGAGATVPTCGSLAEGDAVSRGEVWQGTITPNCLVQHPSGSWSVLAHSVGENAAIRDVAVDDLGNSYVAGSSYGPVQFGNRSSSGFSTGTNRMVWVAKVDPQGTVLWFTTGQGPRNNFVEGIDYHDGQVFVVGRYKDSLSFPGAATLNANGSDEYSYFLGRFSAASGSPQSLTGSGNTDNSPVIRDIHVDASGIYVSGDYTGNASFPGCSLPASALGLRDMFVARLSSSGTCQWARRMGNEDNEWEPFLSPREGGGAYVSYALRGAAAASTTNMLTAVIPPSAGSTGVGMLVSVEPTGAVEWYTALQAPNGIVYPRSVATTSGRSFVAGRFYGDSLTVGPTTLGNPTGLSRLFIAEVDATGGGLDAWAPTGGDGISAAEHLFAVDDTLFVTGTMSDTVEFGASTPEVGTSGAHLFAAFDLGTQRWAWARTGAKEGSSTTTGADAHVDGAGNITLFSAFEGPGGFNITGPGLNLTNPDTRYSGILLRTLGGPAWVE